MNYAFILRKGLWEEWIIIRMVQNESVWFKMRKKIKARR
jgi:hypothetical protein